MLLSHADYIGFEPSAAPISWRENIVLPDRLCFGLLKTDNCVTPHPPILRALNETAAKLKAAGHEGESLSQLLVDNADET